MQKPEFLTPRRRRGARALILGLFAAGLGKVVALGCSPLYAGISGSPPGHWGFSSYSITISETTTSPCYTFRANLYVGPTSSGPWTYKSAWFFSQGSTYGQHTWNVYNASNGTYYWAGKVIDTGSSSAWSPSKGPYITP